MITLIIIAITTGISLLTLNNEEVKSRFMFNAYAISRHREWWRFFTHGVLHGSFWHLFFNMYSLYVVGRGVEYLFQAKFGTLKGEFLYALLYVAALPASSLFGFFKHRDDAYSNSLGASGAVSAIVFALILFIPFVPLNLLIIPMPGWLFAPVFLIASSLMSRARLWNIDHDAHFWGGVFGFLFPIAFQPSLFQDFVWTLKMHFLYGGIPQ